MLFFGQISCKILFLRPFTGSRNISALYYLLSLSIIPLHTAPGPVKIHPE